jgi:biopolymer transport protein ExbB/TolQ
MAALGMGYVLLMIVGVVLLILWLFLPFAVFGMKDILRELRNEQRRTNQLLEAARRDVPTLKDPLK